VRKKIKEQHGKAIHGGSINGSAKKQMVFPPQTNKWKITILRNKNKFISPPQRRL
jgi:hypothetical protein